MFTGGTIWILAHGQMELRLGLRTASGPLGAAPGAATGPGATGVGGELAWAWPVLNIFSGFS